jgi:hypothetical protein
MNMDDDKKITPPEVDASEEMKPEAVEAAAADEGGSESESESPETATASPPPPPAGNNENLLRLFLRSLAGGLRISFALPVDTERLAATPAVLALLVVTDFLFNLAVSFLLVGRSGFFAPSAVPSFFFHLPLLLLLGYLAGRMLFRPSLGIAIPAALVSVSIPVELCHGVLERLSQLRPFEWLEKYLYAPHYYRFFLWWLAVSLIFLLRLKPAAWSRRFSLSLLFLALVVTPLWMYPRADLWVSAAESDEGGELHLTDEVLSAQQRLLDGELAGILPGRKGVTDLYFVGFAGDATQDVFLKELTAAERLFTRRFGTFRRSALLVNNPQTAATLPFATAGNLERTLLRLGQVMNREDVLFLYLTSHGSRDHELAVNNRPLELEGLTPERLSRMLKKSGISWKVVVVSACYAGGFVEPLKDDKTLVITAADATHESFGCGYGEKFTWFGEAFVDDALRRTFSFTAAFEMARDTISQWEEEQRETPSNPQIWVGKDMALKLPALEKQLAKRSSSP